MSDWCTSLGADEAAYVAAIKAELPAGLVLDGISQFPHGGKVYAAFGLTRTADGRKWAATVPGEDGRRPTIEVVLAELRQVLARQGASQIAPSLPS